MALHHAMNARDGRPFPPATLRRIGGFARPHRRQLVAFLFLSVLMAVIAVATPVLAGRVVDAIVERSATSAVGWLAMLIAILAIAEGASGSPVAVRPHRRGADRFRGRARWEGEEMRAVTYDSYAADNSRLNVEDVPDPKVGPGQVLIEVRAAGVNPVDWKVMAGGLDGMMNAIFPVIPGWDVAGVIRALGPDTPEFAPGDEVMSYARKDVVGAGTFAQYVAVSADDVAHKPAALDWNQAGGLPLAGMTAQRALDRLGIGPDDVLLVHAASGGVGGFAVQIGRDRGARVVGTASEKNHDYLRELGAEPVSYGDGLAGRVRELAPGGVSAVADFAGGQLDTTLAVLAAGGRHVSVADNTVDEHGGHWIWVRPSGAKLADLAAMADRGALKVEVAGTYSLDETGTAFDASRGGHTRGKLIITT